MKRNLFNFEFLLFRNLKGILILIFLINFQSFGSLLDMQISGRVTDDENGDPIPGVSVTIKGKSSGTITDSNGEYTILISEESDILVFSFIGYKNQEVQVGSQSVIDVQLVSDTEALSEVVVIGYGTVKKSDLTGSVSTVKGDQLLERPSSNLNQSMAGTMTGVQVNVNSGRPGGRTNVRIRGFSSINSSNNPLYVVDGVMLPQGNQAQFSTAIDYINPNDIVSVEVLKDASSTAIYGARGANGVILVTTKKGQAGEGKLSYSLELSVPTIGPKRPKVLNAKEYLAVEDLAYANIAKFDPDGWASGKYANLDPVLRRTQYSKQHPGIFDANLNPLYDTDWFKASSQNKLSQNHQLNFSGGNNKTTYSLSLNYRDQEGLLKTSYQKRYATRFSIDDQVKKWLKIGATLSFNSQEENLVDINDAVPRQIVEDFPFLPVQYEDGTYANNRDYPQAEGTMSSVHRLMGRRYIVKTNTTLGSIFSLIKFNPNLQMRSILGVNILNQEVSQSSTRTLSISQFGTAQKEVDNEAFWSFENYLTYAKTFNSIHDLTAMIGVSWQETKSNGTRAYVQNFATDYFGYDNLGAGATNPSVGSFASRFAFNSYFGRVNYTLLRKYLFTLTGRADGSSKFGENHKFSFFPSAAFAWRISDEDFMLNTTWLSNLKLRASYGVTGNSEIPPYSSLALLSSTYSTVYGDNRVSGTGINRLANPDLKWERTAQTDVGIEFTVLKGRISLEADYYYRKTTDMLLDAPVPRTSGYAVIRKNIGSMQNKGFEFNLHTINIEHQRFTWNTTFNISLNRNKVLSLATPADIFGVGGPNFTNQTSIIRVGEPVGSFWGLTRLGTWSEAERDEAAQFRSYRNNLPMLPGDIKYADLNGDKAITDADRKIIGNGSPKGWGSFINNFKFGQFNIMLDLQYTYGNKVLDLSLHPSEDRQAIANSYKTVLNAWTPDNQNTPVAQIRETRAGYVTNVDSHWIFDGSFIRGRNLVFSYDFNRALLQRWKMDNLRFYIATQNFFLSTKYPHGDPEMTPSRGGLSNNVFSQGILWHGYPKPTIYLGGFQITI